MLLNLISKEILITEEYKITVILNKSTIIILYIVSYKNLSLL
jgi:hypothetical protein